ncbi:MAG: YceI family protein [Pirellulaceae bacterium]
MKIANILCAVCWCLVLTGGALQAWAQSATFKIDETHTAVSFAISHLGFSETHGRFNTVSGSLTYDAANPSKGSLNVTIDANSIDTNNKQRDDHLRGPDFFNAKQFPKIEFKSSKVEAANDGWNVTGTMTMHGESKEITIPLKKNGEGETPFRDYRIGFSGELKIKRSDFGMKGMIPAEGTKKGIGDEVAIWISFEAVRQ